MLELPAELQSLIVSVVGAFVTYLVVQGFKSLGTALGKDFSKTAKVVAAVVVSGVTAIVLGLIDIGLAAIPENFQPVAVQIFNLIVVFLGAVGFHYSAKKRAVG